MKTNQKYLMVSLVTALTVTAMSVGALSFAQSGPPLFCSTAASAVGVNQVAILTATGGDGTYFWSGQNLSVTNSAGNQFAVSYPNPGSYTVMVASAGQTATCSVSVVGAPTTGSLACFPAVQNVTLGQAASVAATGGDGTYVWSSPDLSSIADPNGSGFSALYGSTGLKTLTVTSAGLVTTCAVNVLANAVPAPVTVTVPVPAAPPL